MFERFDETARRALFFAREEAGAVGASLITVGHIVRGVLREGDVVTRRTLEDLGVPVSSVRDAFPRGKESGRLSGRAELPLSEDAKKVLAYASHTGESVRAKSVGAIFLLLGILRVRESEAAKTFEHLGLTFDKVLEAALRVLAERTADEARDEWAPLALRKSDYDWLEQLAANAPFRAGNQNIVFAIMDALTETGLAQQRFESLQDLTDALKEILQAKWPKP